MTDEDIFFTHTIVGQAMSIEMGRPMDRKSAQDQPAGLHARLVDGHFSLPQFWKEWCLIQRAYPYSGLQTRTPGRFRRWLERRALILAAGGMIMLLSATSLLVVVIWFPNMLPLTWLAPSLTIGPKL